MANFATDLKKFSQKILFGAPGNVILMSMKIPLLQWSIMLVLGGAALAQEYDQDPTEVLKHFEKINDSKNVCTVDPKMEYVCDAMSEFSCKQGTFDDGTGKVLSEDQLSNKFAPLMEKTREFYSADIFKMLQDQDPKFNMVRDLAVQATFQIGTPDCGSSKKSDLRSCHQRVADLMASAHMKKEMNLPFDDSKMISMVSYDFSALNSLIGLKVYSDSIQNAHQKTLDLVTDEKGSRKVEKDIFPKVKRILIGKVQELVSDPEVKRKLINKIESIAYDGGNCDTFNNQQSTAAGLMVPNAFYQPGTNIFKYCNGKHLRVDSEFSIAKVIAHELSHGIDPCNAQIMYGTGANSHQAQKKSIEEIEVQFPFVGVIGCLRSNESIGALSKSPQELRSRPFCEDDQINEAFADWMGTEVLAEYTEKHNSSLSPRQKLIGYSNTFRDFCNYPDSKRFEVHPSTKSRIDRILMANPKVRKQIGCGEPKNGLHYCKAGEDFKGNRAVYVPPPEPTPASNLSPNPGGSSE